MSSAPNNQLHGVTLEALVTRLQAHYGWEALAQKIDINCFKSDPSLSSSLKFLRRTPWARAKVESLYLATFAQASDDKPVSYNSAANSTPANALSVWGKLALDKSDI